MPDQAKPLFDLCAGHPALDFVNSLDNRFRDDGPQEILVDYGTLLEFTEQSELLTAQQVRVLTKAASDDAGARALESARELREATAAVFYGSVDRQVPPNADIRTLERYFLSAVSHRELQWEAASRAQPGVAWHWGRYVTEPELPVWALAQSVSDLMLSADVARVRTCGVETCRWLFLDTSKNHTRRWCNMKICGNRMKARRFQERKEE